MRYSTTTMERLLYAAQLLPDGSVIRLSARVDSALSLFLGMLQPMCVVIGFALVLALFLAHRAAKQIMKPLNELNLDEPHKNAGYEEITPLLRRLESQQRQLRAQKQELLRRQEEFATITGNMDEGVVLLFFDVTEKSRTEQIRREFTANVSHELKTPLHTISGCAELLENGLVRPEDEKAFVRQIHGEARRMIRLVEDILNLSHLDEGAEDMVRENTDLYALAKQAVESLSAAAEKADVTLSLSGERVVVYGVPQLLQGILYNLCDNGVKYNRPGGRVDISVERCPGAARLTVADTGIGIPEEHRQCIFERFYRADKSRSREVGGTGLGLSIVKHAARIHGAAVELKSEPGQGTVIAVLFPMESEEN